MNPFMVKVKHTVVAENLHLCDIASFVTENYVGIWNHTIDRYVLFARNDCEFHATALENCKDLGELDGLVCEECGEHILYVSECSDYTFKLSREE